MIAVSTLTRPILPAYRILRERKTSAGWALDNVSWSGSDALTIHAPDAETALERARKLVANIHGLVAVKEAV